MNRFFTFENRVISLKRIIFAFLASIMLIPTLAGCGVAVTKTLTYTDADIDMSTLQNSTVAENTRFRLDWDDKYKRVVLIEKSTGIIWSTTPTGALTPCVDESGMPIPTNPQLNSPILIEYIEPVTFETKTASAYVESISGGTVELHAIKNGINVIYYFADIRIAIPVEYTLHDNGLTMSVDSGAIKEDENKVSKVIFAPFMCSADHDGEDGYVMVPSGSGALIEARERGNTPVVYSQEVYGDDANRYKEYQQNITNTEAIRLPVFGSYDGDVGLFGIIESGAAAASIEVSAGSSNIGYTGVTAAFSVRGYQWIKVSGKGEFNRKFSNSKTNKKLTVSYYPLTGEKANYTAMAQIYREFLWGKKPPKSMQESMLSIQLLGGVMLKESLLGIPRDVLHPLTSSSQAQEIIDDIKTKTGYTPTVNLLGFGSTGLDIGEIGGGFSVNKKLGGKKGIKELSNYCAANNVLTYMDFELAFFNKSGNGVSLQKDKALDICGQSTAQYIYSMWSRGRDENFSKYFLVSPTKLSKVSNRALDTVKELGITGVGIRSLSSVCYSDYSDEKYFVKIGMATEVEELIANYSKQGIKTAVNGGNAYATAQASMIFDTPMQSAKYELFDATIPFYAMVFKGFVPMSSVSLNLESETQESILRSIESGVSPAFTLIAEYNMKLLESSQKGLYGVAYSDNQDLVVQTMEKYGKYFEAVRGARITEHKILENGLRKTIFDNGVSVFVNYTDRELSVNDTVVPAKMYTMTQEGKS